MHSTLGGMQYQEIEFLVICNDNCTKDITNYNGYAFS